MCLVIDTCCLSQVFNRTNKRHGDFVPVFEWVVNGKGRMIYGGTKYKTELKQADRKLLPVLTELVKARRILKMEDARVDSVANALKVRVPDRKFDDEHLVALVIVSRCCVVCTHDEVATSYLKRAELYSHYRVRRPKIYKSNSHRTLCCDKHVVSVCREDAT